MQAIPSSQLAWLGVWMHPATAMQLSSVQGLPSSQPVLAIAMPTQLPVEQSSKLVHALPSSQAAVVATKTHPLIGVQLSLVQGFLSSQALTAPMQAPV